MINVLILGGYGNVGRMIALYLVQQTNMYVVLRNGTPNQQRNSHKNWKTGSARKIDLFISDKTLQNVDIVVVCVDLIDDRLSRKKH